MKISKIGKVLIRILGSAVALGALAALYFALIIAQPQGRKAEKADPQPLLTASPALRITEETDLRELVRAFPVPVMSFMSGSGMTFVSGTSEDAAFQGQYGRILTLYWQTADGTPLILQSIYPAEALELMGKNDYTFSGTAGPALFGQNAVRMENRETIRVHVQAEGRGLYVLTVPKSLGSSLSGISRSIQLFTAE